MGCDEPQRPVGTVTYTDAGRHFDRLRLPAFVTDDDGCGWFKDGQLIVGAGDTEGARKAAGAGDALNAADKDAARHAIGLGDQIKALIHAVNEVDIGAAGRTKDYSGAGCNAASGVGCLIVEAEVGLDFRNGSGMGAAHKNFAEKIAGHRDGVAGVKGFGEDAQWVD